MPEFDAARARAKRPVPMWADAFLRDTMHLGADEIGAYHLIIYAMWKRPGCDVHDDDARLIKITRLSAKAWKSRVGPTLREFFESRDGMLVSPRLQKEARYVERQLRRQSERRKGAGDQDGDDVRFPEGDHVAFPEPSTEGSEATAPKPLESNNPGQSAEPTTDTTAEHPRHHPSPTTQQPNSRESFFVGLSK